MGIFINVIVTAATVFGTLWGIYQYVPLGAFEVSPLDKKVELQLGADITTIQGTDTLKDSRAIINTNFSNLNAYKIENSTTSVAAITTLSNLASIGTITTGVWNGTGIDVARQGTGTTSPTANLVILGNGSSGFKVINGPGTSGQFLQSQGAGSAPTWAASAINEGADYTWTGLHTFNHATTTFSNTANLNLGGLGLRWPTTGMASGTALMVGYSLGAGNTVAQLKWQSPDWQLIGETVTTTTTVGLEVTDLPARRYLRVVLIVPGRSAASTGQLLFNGDGGANYAYRTITDEGAPPAASVNQSEIDMLHNTGGATNSIIVTIDIVNISGSRKLVDQNSVADLGAPGTAPEMRHIWGAWNNTSAQITRIRIGHDDTTTFNAGTILSVYGSAR